MADRTPFLIVLAALLILGLLVVIGLVSQLRQLTSLVPAIFEKEIEQRLDRKTSVASVSMLSPGMVVVRDLAVANGKTFDQGTLFSARRVVVRFSAMDLLLGRAPGARGIKTITLVDPRVELVRDSRKRWNVEDLLRRPAVRPEERFRGVVRVESGGLVIVDYAAAMPELPVKNSLAKVQGELDFAAPRSFLADLTGVGAHRRVEQVKLVGQWGIDAPLTNMNLSVRGADAKYWLGYFSDIRSWRLDGGRFDADAVLEQPRGAAIVARGSATIQGGTITSPYLALPVDPFNANIEFVGANIAVDGKGYLEQYPVQIQGHTLGFEPMRLDLRITSERIGLSTLQTAIKLLPTMPRTDWPAPATLSAVVTGTATDTVVNATAAVSKGTVYGVQVMEIVARGSYRDGVIRLTNAKARAANGSIELAGTIRLQPTRVTMRGRALALDLSTLPVRRDLRAGGLADMRFVLDYAPKELRAELSADVTHGRLGGLAFARGRADATVTGPDTADAAISISEGMAGGVPIQTAKADLSLRGRRILVREAVLDAFQGIIAAEGTATTEGALDLAVAAEGLDVGALLAAFDYREVTGSADFAGTLTGRIGSPRLDVLVTARDGRVRGAGYDLFAGRLTASPERMVLQDGLLRLDKGEIATTGTMAVARDKPPEFALRISAREVALADVFGILGRAPPAAGILAGDLDASGVLPDLRVSGNLEVADAVVSDIPIDLAAARFQYEDGRTVISELVARRDGMQLVGKGFVGPRGELQVDLLGEKLELALLDDVLYPYAKLQGPMEVNAELRGSLASPTVRVEVASAQPVLNSRRFDSLGAEILWDGDVLTVTDGALLGDQAEYRVPSITFDPTAGAFEIKASVLSENLAPMLDLARNSPVIELPQGAALRELLAGLPERLSGTITASLEIAGPLTRLLSQAAGAVSFTAQDVSLMETPVGTVTAGVRLLDGTLFLDEVALTPPEGRFVVRGNISPDGLMSLSGTGEAVPLSIFRRWFVGDTLAGAADFEFTAVGPVDSPIVQGSFEASDVQTPSISAAAISGKRVVIAAGRASSDGIVVRSNGSRLLISGSVPFAWRRPFLAPDQPVRVRAELLDQSFSIAESLREIVEDADGVVTGDVEIAGTINEPVLDGTIRLRDGFVNLRRFENDFTDVNVSGRFEGSTLLIETFKAASSLGGSFSGGGNITLTDISSGLLTMFVTLDSLRLHAVDLSGGIGEELLLTATGQLVATETVRSPVIEGRLVVSDARILIPKEVAPPTLQIPQLPINPRLAVTVDLARDVVIERGSLKVAAVGPVTIGATLARPVIAGTLQVRDGRLSYVGRTLVVQRGGTASFLFEPPQRTLISVDMTATTRLTATSPITGRLTRYTVFLDMAGPVGALDVSVRSSPPGLSRSDVLGFVFAGTAYEAFIRDRPLEEVFQEQLAQAILGIAFSRLFEPAQLEGVTLAIEPGYDVPLQVTAATPLTERLNLSYSRSLAGQVAVDTLGLSYTVSPKLALTLMFEGQDGAPRDTTYLVQYFTRF